jgi:hypothetical protein
MTPPPSNKFTSNMANAARAKKLIAYLTSPDFVANTKNIYVFDFFNLLADNSGFLKPEYSRFIPFDSHPNKLANETVSPILAKYINNLAK